MINASEIMRAQLARSLGLDKYAEIMRGDPASPSFQRAFNGYYRIRRNEAWRNSYYALFLRARTESFDFSQIITALFQATGNVEASFSSKMLATIDLLVKFGVCVQTVKALYPWFKESVYWLCEIFSVNTGLLR